MSPPARDGAMVAWAGKRRGSEMDKQEAARARFGLLNENQLDLLHAASLRILAISGCP